MYRIIKNNTNFSVFPHSHRSVLCVFPDDGVTWKCHEIRSSTYSIQVLGNCVLGLLLIAKMGSSQVFPRVTLDKSKEKIRFKRRGQLRSGNAKLLHDNSRFGGKNQVLAWENTTGKYCNIHHIALIWYHQILFLFGPLKKTWEELIFKTRRRSWTHERFDGKFAAYFRHGIFKSLHRLNDDCVEKQKRIYLIYRVEILIYFFHSVIFHYSVYIFVPYLLWDSPRLPPRLRCPDVILRV